VTGGKALISGAGIAGCCLGWWLRRYGFEVTIVERAERPRDGGYVIDFWGLGYTVADKMGLMETDAVLRALDAAEDLYFDRVSQIAVPQWSRGRVALIGDACACPSLLAGEGSAMAMAEAYVLAGELHAAGGDHARAFAAYEARLRPYVERKQKAARGFASGFVPTVPRLRGFAATLGMTKEGGDSRYAIRE